MLRSGRAEQVPAVYTETLRLLLLGFSATQFKPVKLTEKPFTHGGKMAHHAVFHPLSFLPVGYFALLLYTEVRFLSSWNVWVPS